MDRVDQPIERDFDFNLHLKLTTTSRFFLHLVVAFDHELY